MSYKRLIDKIVDNHLCTMCGMCEAICPADVIKLDSFGHINKINAQGKCIECNMCEEICPGKATNIPFIEKKIFGRKRYNNERWFGIFDQLYDGCSIKRNVLENSASGGCATTLLSVAMKKFDLDYILVAGRCDKTGWKAEPIMCESISKIEENSQSTYQLFPYLGILKKYLNKKKNVRIGVIGLPCHVIAIRKAQAMDNEIGKILSENIPVVMELACSSNTKVEGTISLIEQIANIDVNDVKNIKYREGEYPGKVVIYTNTDQKVEIPFWKAVQHFANYKTERCLKCPDWVSGLADISFWDGDQNVFKSSFANETGIKKTSTIAVRTKKGEQILRYAVDNDMIEICPKKMDISQNFGLLRKRNRYAMYERDNNEVIPDAPIINYKDDFEIVDDREFIKKVN